MLAYRMRLAFHGHAAGRLGALAKVEHGMRGFVSGGRSNEWVLVCLVGAMLCMSSLLFVSSSWAAGPRRTAHKEVFDVTSYGAIGDGVSDDTAPFKAWMRRLCENGGHGYIPPGHYLINQPLGCALEGVTVSISGSGKEVTQLLFGPVDRGLSFDLLLDSAGTWGGASVANLSIVRLPVSPPLAGSALTLTADPKAGKMYYGSGLIADVAIRGPTQATGWAHNVTLTNIAGLEMRNDSIRGPAPQSASDDYGLLISAPASTMFSTAINLIDTQIQGFATGIAIRGHVQGVTITGGTIIGDWWGINVSGIDGAQSYFTAAPAPAGAPITVLPSDTALLSVGMVVDGINITPASRISAINTATGDISLEPKTTGSIARGALVLFRAPTVAEQLTVSNSTFNAAHRDILATWDSLSTISNNTLIRFGRAAADWAAIDLEDGNDNTITANTVLGNLSGRETGIVVASRGAQGRQPITIVGNTISTIAGAGIALKGTVSGATVVGNSIYGAAAAVTAERQNANAIIENQFNGGKPDLSLDTTNGDAISNNKRFIFTGHVGSVQPSGFATAVSSCGHDPRLVEGSSDVRGVIEIGTGSVTACTLNFGRVFETAPFCVATLDSLTGSMAGATRGRAFYRFRFVIPAGDRRLSYVCLE